MPQLRGTNVRSVNEATAADRALSILAAKQGWPTGNIGTAFLDGSNPGYPIISIDMPGQGIVQLESVPGDSFHVCSYVSEGNGIAFTMKMLPQAVCRRGLTFGRFLELVKQHGLDSRPSGRS
jgi:hypothetical protein